jgi:hypothetical protein
VIPKRPRGTRPSRPREGAGPGWLDWPKAGCAAGLVPCSAVHLGVDRVPNGMPSPWGWTRGLTPPSGGGFGVSCALETRGLSEGLRGDDAGAKPKLDDDALFLGRAVRERDALRRGRQKLLLLPRPSVPPDGDDGLVELGWRLEGAALGAACHPGPLLSHRELLPASDYAIRARSPARAEACPCCDGAGLCCCRAVSPGVAGMALSRSACRATRPTLSEDGDGCPPQERSASPWAALRNSAYGTRSKVAVASRHRYPRPSGGETR